MTQLISRVSILKEANNLQFKKALIWYCITGNQHPALKPKERTIKSIEPLVETLFPGANYYSMTGFGQVMRECVVPALKKRFPEMESLSAAAIKAMEKVEVGEFLPSKGCEWQNSSRWQSKFKKLLAA